MNYTKQIIKTQNGTITIHSPIISDSEKKKREQEVITALIRIGKEIEKELEEENE